MDPDLRAVESFDFSLPLLSVFQTLSIVPESVEQKTMPSKKTSLCEGRKVSAVQSEVVVSLSHGSDGEAKIDRICLAKRYLEVFLAEVIGTAFLMLIGCLALVRGFNDTPIGPAYVPVCFGMAVATIIQVFGHVSAAHLNPAVTVAFFVLGQISIPMVVNYLFAEIIGAYLGMALIKTITPDDIWGLSENTGLCCTVPHATLTVFQALFVEFLATSFLIFLVCSSSDPISSNKQDGMALKFGVLVTVVSNVFGPMTGCSMNPARSLAPALWAGIWTDHWIYWIGPISAGVVVPLLYTAIFQSKEREECFDQKLNLLSKLKL